MSVFQIEIVYDYMTIHSLSQPTVVADQQHLPFCKTEVRSLLEYVDDDGDGRLDFSEILEYAWWHFMFIVFIVSYRFIKLGCFMFSL